MEALCISETTLRTTPNEALNAILNLPSLNLAGMERVRSAAIRLRTPGSGKPKFMAMLKFLSMINRFRRKRIYANLLNTVTHSLRPWFQIERNAICFYTDGSKLEKQVGGGVYSEQLDIKESFRLPGHCSVFQAEVRAIKEALNCLGNISLQRGHLNIYSDSQAAIKSIYSTSTNSRTIADFRRSFHETASQFTISLIWVPGHWYIVGNCTADELARQGTIMPLLPGMENVGMPMTTFKLNINNFFNELANTHWENAPQCRISHQTWPVINNK